METTYLKQYENTPDHWSIYSFSGGPTQLPRYVGHDIYNEFLSHRDTGVSILETPSKGKEFHMVLHQALDDLRSLYNVMTCSIIRSPQILKYCSVPAEAQFCLTLFPWTSWGTRLLPRTPTLAIGQIEPSMRLKLFSQICTPRVKWRYFY